MGTFASTQVINRRIRIRPCLGSSDYELWDKVERKLITRTVYHSYADAFLARCAVERGYENQRTACHSKIEYARSPRPGGSRT